MKRKEIITGNYSNLPGRVAEILTDARSKVIREIKKAQVLAYWGKFEPMLSWSP